MQMLQNGFVKSAVGALFLCLAGVAQAAEPIFGTATVTIETAAGPAHEFAVEFAATPDQRARGLMERTELSPDAGMIFDFAVEREVMMWMKNTPLPLDMLFVASDGEIKRVAENTEPYSETIVPSRSPVRYVLEINGGRASELGIAAGDHLKLSNINQR